jgi:hypothetical protein
MRSNLFEVNLKSSALQLYKARLRGKSGGKSIIVYRMGKWSHGVHEQLKKEYGDNFFVSEVKSMTPEQIVRAANKHLPSIL